MYTSWSTGDVFSIKIAGTGEWVRKAIATLVEDFNEPKFGYNGELWDEDYE